MKNNIAIDKKEVIFEGAEVDLTQTCNKLVWNKLQPGQWVFYKEYPQPIRINKIDPSGEVIHCDWWYDGKLYRKSFIESDFPVTE